MGMLQDRRQEVDFDVNEAIKGVFKRATEVTTMKGYQGLFNLFAAAKHAKAANDKELLAFCRSYLDLYPDNIEHVHYSFNFNTYGSIGKAYLTMEGEYPDYLNEIRECAEITYQRLMTDDGILCHHSMKNGKLIWVDSVAFVAPFMVYAGVMFKEPRYYIYGANQVIRMYDALLDAENGLVHQSRGFRGKADIDFISEDHWSRGNGWMMVGFVETLEYLPKTCPLYKEVESRFVRFCEGLVKFQSPRGLWRQDVAVEESWEESSGSGLITYGIGAGIRLGILKDEKYNESLKKAVWGLCYHCMSDEYNTYHCCEGCMAPTFRGVRGTKEAYIVATRPYNNEPHSFGCIMLGLSEGYRQGIVSVKRLQQFKNTISL